MSWKIYGPRLCLGCGRMLPHDEFRSWERCGIRRYATRCKPCEAEADARTYRKRALRRVEREYHRRMAEAARRRRWQEHRLAEQRPLQFKD